MNIRPLYDRVIVKRLEAEVKTKSGLYIPETAKETSIEKNTSLSTKHLKLQVNG